MIAAKPGNWKASEERSRSGWGRFIFFYPGKHGENASEKLENILGRSGAEVVRRMRSGDVVAYADAAILESLRVRYPEVHSEPDFEMGFC